MVEKQLVSFVERSDEMIHQIHRAKKCDLVYNLSHLKASICNNIFYSAGFQKKLTVFFKNFKTILFYIDPLSLTCF